MSAVEEAGLVVGMDDETYHGDPVEGGSLSSTFARALTEAVPAKARERFANRKPSRAMNLGKAAHREALGVGPELVVWQLDGRTVAGKAERAEWKDRIAAEQAVAVDAAEHDQIKGMAAALLADPQVRAVWDTCEHEVSGFARDGHGVWMRARFDLLSDAEAWDYKTTTSDATLREFGRSMGRFGYHQQADWYLRVLRHLGHPAGSAPFRFIVQETEAPYLVQVHTPDQEAMAVAAALNDRALEVYAECAASGVWPGYDQVFVDEPARLRPGYFWDHKEVLPPEWQPDLEMSL